MRIYDVAFYIAGFFLIGVLVYGFKLNFLTIFVLTALLAVLFLLTGFIFSKKKLFWIAGFSLIIISGAMYSGFYEFYQKESINIVFDKKMNFSGLVVRDPERGNTQQLTLKLQEPLAGNILVKLPAYPAFNYGDLINFEGTIQSPEPEDYANYLAKNRIFGITSSPKTQLVSENNGSFIEAALFKFKSKIITSFQKVFGVEQAAFMGGLVIGERAEFTQEFKDAMSKSGTTHLVALSGYNISIIVLAAAAMFGAFFSRRLTFYLTSIVILAFVLMTGAEASVVRAAIMGFLALLATQMSRVSGTRNIITLAAFFMVLINPRILRFDTGFQLSFLALLGIIYLGPAIKKFFRVKEGEGFLGWRENLITTTSAQLAVLPVLIFTFDRFSPISLLTNVLILEFIPPTMFLGFVIAALSFISQFLAQILAWFASLFLNYEIGIIKFFGSFDFSINKISLGIAAIYYLILILFIIYNQKFLPKINNNPPEPEKNNYVQF